uniref:Putative capsid protein n=1 Tax=Ciconia boyciana CRESS-DNA-virus sp. TaxID=2815024 RepID=A0A8A4XCQ5_9VIRU|nr:MAG: putative capsid protein [Ciconia boyciana CRESS-DNA-virus sp.]
MSGKRRWIARARAEHNIAAANLGALHSALQRNAAKRRKLTHKMDTTMEASKNYGERDEGNQHEAFMIPGVDGRLQFGFPTKIITILRYYDQYSLTSTSGGIGAQVFRMNGPRDPDFTGVGHQPLYWDRYSTLYQSYRVLGSKISAVISPTTLSAPLGPWTFGINGSTSSTSMGTSATARAEQNDGISVLFNQQQGPTSLTFSYSPEIKLGRPNGDDTVGAFVSTEPTNQYFAHVWFNDMNGATSTAIMRCCLEYTIEFHGLVQEPLS